MRKRKMFLSRFIVAMIVLAMYACSTEEPKNNKDMLTTSIVTDITPTTAKSGGSQINTASGVILSKGIVWNTSPSPTVDHFSKSAGEGYAAFVCDMTNLQHNTKYYVRAYVTNQNGIFYGNEVSFTTLAKFTDIRDGNVYNWVKIGNQIWMAENLRYLPRVVGPGTSSETTPYYYVYGYDGTSVAAAKARANYKTYGVLYNWKAACNSCPDGWHLPSDAEWAELVQFVSTTGNSGLVLRSTSGWYGNSNGTDDYVFTALLGGYRSSGSFYDIGEDCYWWSATERDEAIVLCPGIVSHFSYVDGYLKYKYYGLSVRCVRD